MKKNVLLGFLAIAVVGLIAVIGYSTAYRGDQTLGGVNFRIGGGRQMRQAMFGGLGFPENASMGEARQAAWTQNLEDLGLPENATMEEVREAVFKKRLEELGLTEDSTIGEFREAVKARRQALLEERLSELREKLGLPENTSEEDVREAMKENMGERTGFHPGFAGGRMMGVRFGSELGGCRM